MSATADDERVRLRQPIPSHASAGGIGEQAFGPNEQMFGQKTGYPKGRRPRSALQTLLKLETQPDEHQRTSVDEESDETSQG